MNAVKFTRAAAAAPIAIGVWCVLRNALAAILLLAGSFPAAADTFQIQSLELKRLASADAVKEVTGLLSDKAQKKTLETLCQHLNTSDESFKLRTDAMPWRFGAVVPRGFRFTDSQKNLGKVLKFGSEAGFVLYAKVRVTKNGVEIGQRPVRLTVLDLQATRNVKKPYSAALMIGRDLQTGKVLFQRSLVSEFADNNPLVIHEFTVDAKGQVWRTSNKKGETLILGSYGIASGASKAAAEIMSKRTLPAAQKVANAYKQVKQLVISDQNANVNATVVAGVEVSTSEVETSWKEIRSQLLEALKDAFKKLAKSLLDQAKEYLKEFGDALANALKDIVKGVLDWLKGLLGF